MRKIKETDTELYLEIDIEDLPISIEGGTKTIFIILAEKSDINKPKVSEHPTSDQSVD